MSVEMDVVNELKENFDYVFILKNNSTEKRINLQKSNSVVNLSIQYFVRLIKKSDIVEEIAFETNSLENILEQIKSQHTIIKPEFCSDDFFFSDLDVADRSIVDNFDNVINSFSQYLSSHFSKYLSDFDIEYSEDDYTLFSNIHEPVVFKRNSVSYDYDFNYNDGSLGYGDQLKNIDVDVLEKRLNDDFETVKLLSDAKLLDVKPKAIVFSPETFFELFNNAFLPNFKEMFIISNNSCFDSIYGKKIFGSWSVCDSPNFEHGLNNVVSDFEGTKAVDAILIDNGKVNTAITSRKNCKEIMSRFNSDSFRPKGNFFSELIFRDLVFSNPELINLNIDLMKNNEDILYVKDVLGSHTSNFVTTDFSVSVDVGFFNSKPVKGVIISGNFIKIFSKMKPMRFVVWQGSLVPYVYIDDFSDLNISF